MRKSTRALLRAARAALDSLADSDALTTAQYDDLSARIGEAERAAAASRDLTVATLLAENSDALEGIATPDDTAGGIATSDERIRI